MFELFIFIIFVTFIYFGGLEGVFSLIGGILQGVIWIATAIPVIVGLLGFYFIYWIAYVA